MLRTLLIATALLTASGTALARGDDGYGRVISVEPNFVVSFGNRHHDGFRVLYESGGSRYWTHSYYRPGPVIVLPHRYAAPSYRHYRDDRRDWRHDRRDDRHDRRDNRRHDRYDRYDGHR